MRKGQHKSRDYTFKAMINRGWGRSVIYRGQEIIVICPPGQLTNPPNPNKKESEV